MASTVARVHGVKGVGPKDFAPQIGAPVDIDSQGRDEQIAILMSAAPTTKPS